MTTFPIVHNNGTSKNQLLRAICDANQALDATLTALAQTAPNMRDYYLTDNFKQAANEYSERMQQIRKIQNEIMEIAENIADQ